MQDEDTAEWLLETTEDGCPQPPSLDSDRVRSLAGRGLLDPTELDPDEVQELAASVISHVIATTP